jgi:predicted aspartyl protease
MVTAKRRGAIMDDMGIFRTSLEVAAFGNSDKRVTLPEVLVDTGSEYTWIPEDVLVELGVEAVRVDRFETAEGRILERPVGFALVYAGGRSTATVVVFAGPGDRVLLGAQALDGLNLRVDLGRRELVPGGPLPAAVAA